MKREASPKGLWLLALLAVPFAAAGIGIFWFMVVVPVADWARMQTWKPVPAMVESATLQSHRGSKGGTTHSVSVRYRYAWDGVTHTGQRAAIHERPDNIGSFHEQLGRRLKAAQSMGTPVQVWVNPALPSESIADRSLRPGLVGLALGIAVLCGGFGFLVLTAMVRKLWGSLRAAAAL